MKLLFELKHRLPRLAWIATVEPEKQKALVAHGPWVEVMEKGFIEGIWDAPFDDAAFDTTSCVFGSGALVRNQSITFVSSTSTTDYLYWWSSEDRSHVAIANSLPILLASLGDELDPQVRDYDFINRSIMSGIDRYVRRLPTRKGAVNRLIHCNLTISPGEVAERDKPLPPQFETFDEYAIYLTDCYGRLAANARDSNRLRPMAIFSTQSRGYDTTAANAVAKEHGIDKVFTVTKGKAIGYFADEDREIETNDDGTGICDFFGLTCIPIDRRALERNSETEYLFYAALHETGDFNLLQVSTHVVQPTVLITGCLGEIWSTHKSYYRDHPGVINGNLMRGDLGNHGLTEVRLQAGYVQLALPYIGARSRESIFRITESDTMEPWRLRNEYDRPIPRRLAEQAGLPRNMFGQVKMASVLEFPSPATPVGEILGAEFLAFLVEQRLLTRLQCRLLPLVRRWNAIVESTSPHRHAWNYYLQRVLSRLLKRPFYFHVVWRRLNGAIFCFCVNRRIADYRLAFGDLEADNNV